MKKVFIALLISLTFFSCSLNDDLQSVNLEIVAIQNVEMPTAYKVDSITQIPISYVLPTSCHEFSNFYYNSIGNERTVAVYCVKNNNQNCIPSPNYEITVPLNFKPKNTGNYHFRFWTGVNENGVDQYIEHEVVVDH
jgi:hypothetical protein